MSDDLKPNEVFVRKACGDLFEALLVAMRDYAVAPMALWAALDTSGVGVAHRNCVDATRALLERCSSTENAALREHLPWHLEDALDLAEALVEDALSGSFFALEGSVFEAKPRSVDESLTVRRG